MTFDPIAWAARHGATPGPPVELPPAVTSIGAMYVDTHSLLCSVDPALAAVTVEARLREEDLTLGLFPERYEVASVGELVEDDDPGAGARGAGFATLLRGTEHGLLLLDVRRRPAAHVRARTADRVVRGRLRGAPHPRADRCRPGDLAARRSGRGRPAARGGRRSGRCAGLARRRQGAADPGGGRPAGRSGRPRRARDRRLRGGDQRGPRAERGAGVGRQPLRPADACRHARRPPATASRRRGSGIAGAGSTRARRGARGSLVRCELVGVSGQGAVLQHRVLCSTATTTAPAARPRRPPARRPAAAPC